MYVYNNFFSFITLYICIYTYIHYIFVYTHISNKPSHTVHVEDDSGVLLGYLIFFNFNILFSFLMLYTYNKINLLNHVILEIDIIEIIHNQQYHSFVIVIVIIEYESI